MSYPTTVDRGIALAKGGDSASLGSLLEGYRAYLRMLARFQIGRRLQSKLDSDDLLQETFLRAHQAIRRFRGATEEEFLAWLRGILAHVLADQIRPLRWQNWPRSEAERALSSKSTDLPRGSVLVAPTSSLSQRSSVTSAPCLAAGSIGFPLRVTF